MALQHPHQASRDQAFAAHRATNHRQSKPTLYTLVAWPAPQNMGKGGSLYIWVRLKG